MRPTPLEIEKLGDRDMRIVWDDGHVSVYSNPALRFGCSCAQCIDEWTGERRLEFRTIASDIRPTALELVGNYALQITWSDGHATGIYSYDHLRALCPCTACAGAVKER